MRLDYGINPRKISLILGIFAIYLAVQSLINEYLIENVLDSGTNRSLILLLDLFSVNAELTIPTWYSTLLLFTTAVLLVMIADEKRVRGEAYTRYWIGLAVIFLYLSVDEGAAIHEIVADVLQTELDLTGYLSFGWQLVAAPLVLLFVLVYLRFLLRLPSRTRNLFIVAGLLHVGGALGVEAVSANQWYLDGEITFRYLAIATVEELSEMLGVVVFIYALLAYAVEMNYRLVFHPEQRTGETGKPVGDVIQDLRSFFRRRPVILVAFLILGLNLVLVSCAFTRESVPEPTAQDVATYTEGLIDQFVSDDVVVMVLPGRFNIQNIAAREAVASLITLYDEVMVVVLPSRELSIALAGDALPYDRESLSNLLTEQGAIEFIIFDTSAVNVIVGNMESGTQDG